MVALPSVASPATCSVGGSRRTVAGLAVVPAPSVAMVEAVATVGAVLVEWLVDSAAAAVEVAERRPASVEPGAASSDCAHKSEADCV